MKHYLMLLIAVIMLGILLTGCGKVTIKGDDGEKGTINLKDIKDGKINVETEDKDGEKGSFGFNVDEEDESATMSMDTEDGQFNMEAGEGTELPEGFPDDFPIPDDAVIEISNTMTQDDDVIYSVHFFTDKSPEDLYQAVKQYAEEKGMEIDLDNQSETNGLKTYMVNANDANGEYFQYVYGMFEEDRGNINYGVPQ